MHGLSRTGYATDVCRSVEPALVDHGRGRLAACQHPLYVQAGRAP